MNKQQDTQGQYRESIVAVESELDSLRGKLQTRKASVDELDILEVLVMIRERLSEMVKVHEIKPLTPEEEEEWARQFAKVAEATPGGIVYVPEGKSVQDMPAPQPTSSGALAGGILREAAGIVEGARNATHGDKERSFEAIATLWNAYLSIRRGGPRHGVSAYDVAVLMGLMKIVRGEQGQPIRDHYVDTVGYFGIAAELAKVPAK